MYARENICCLFACQFGLKRTGTCQACDSGQYVDIHVLTCMHSAAYTPSRGPRSTSGPRRVPRRGRRLTRHRYRAIGQSGNRSSARTTYLYRDPFPSLAESVSGTAHWRLALVPISPAPRPRCAEVEIPIRREPWPLSDRLLGGCPAKPRCCPAIITPPPPETICLCPRHYLRLCFVRAPRLSHLPPDSAKLQPRGAI